VPIRIQALHKLLSLTYLYTYPLPLTFQLQPRPTRCTGGRC